MPKWKPFRFTTEQGWDDVERLRSEAVNRTQPQIVLHGHWHRANREHVSQRTEIIGLTNDERHDHTELLTLSDPPRADYL